MKRLPAAVWICLPLALGLLYALLAPLFETSPEHDAMAPPGAVLVERFRDFDTFDRDYYFPLGPGAPSQSAILGVENNLGRLAGVDRDRPLYLVKMPFSQVGTDPTVVVFPVADRDALEGAFFDPEMLEKGLIRRAKHMERHGSFAAVGARRSAIRGVGRGTLSARQRDEDFSIAAFLPGLGVTAWQGRHAAPWRGVIEALVDGDPDGGGPAVEIRQDTATGAWLPIVTGAPRLARLLETWRIARLWSWRAKRRVELELVPHRPEGLPWLAAAAKDEQDTTAVPREPPSFQEARMWLRVPNATARTALLELVHTLGVNVPEELRKAQSGGGLLVLATRAAGHPYAASYAIASERATPLDLAPLLGTIPGAGERAERPAGTLPMTMIDLGSDRTAPAGYVVHEVVGELDVVGVGASAPAAVTRVRQVLERKAARPAEDLGEDDWRVIVRFGADRGRAERLLGSTIGERGLLGALAGGPVRGEIRTDGRAVRITLQGQPER